MTSELSVKSPFIMAWIHHRFAIISAVIFQLAWLSAVVGRYDGLLPLTLLFIVHLCLTPTLKQDIRTFLKVTLLGLAIDTGFSAVSLFQFANSELLPFWLLLLWSHFALTINHGFAFLRRFPLWSVGLAGAVAGPLSYFAGSRLDAVVFPHGSVMTCLILAFVWACLMPLMLQLSSSGEASSEATMRKPQTR